MRLLCSLYLNDNNTLSLDSSIIDDLRFVLLLFEDRICVNDSNCTSYCSILLFFIAFIIEVTRKDIKYNYKIDMQEIY